MLLDNPTVGPLFYFIEDGSEKGLRANEQLKKHGIGVMKTVNTAVTCLDDAPKLAKALQGLGGRHHSKGVTVDLFKVRRISPK